MSQLLIQHYLNQLRDLRKVSGTHRESVVREAFKDLLKGWARSHDLIFVPEYEIAAPTKDRRYVDGALLYALRVPFGYWEAKDEKDDLDAEIEFKFKRGYPQDNIIFEDSREAVLIQNRQQVMRCSVNDVTNLEKLLGLFFGYQRPEIAAFGKAVGQFKADLPAVLAALRDMIEAAEKGNADFRTAAHEFLRHAQQAINPSLTEADVREMLIQHVLTEELFAAVFPGTPFHQDNNVAHELYKLEATFFTGNTKYRTLKALEPYYAAIRAAAAQLQRHNEKQTFLKSLYENFYKVYNRKAADRLGVVYTPNEIVRFMIESADWLCEKHFGRNLIDRDVDILDPAAGTGTFICELLEHFRGQPAKLQYKYEHELHANEVAILPYYVANLNIEATYAAIAGEYREFPSLCFVDTLDNTYALRKHKGHMDDLFGGMSDENVGRIRRQNSRVISVIIGNPPYNANQLNENENNKNREYPEIDKRIKETYIAASTAQKTKLYDMYARFFRWAADRLDENGILAFITNRSFIDSAPSMAFGRWCRKSSTRFTSSIWAATCVPTPSFQAPHTTSSASRPAWQSASWSSAPNRRAAGFFTRGGRRWKRRRKSWPPSTTPV
jgi:predicted helicase